MSFQGTLRRVTEIRHYRFYNDISDDIVEKHNLERFSVFDDEKKCDGIKLLEQETLKELMFYHENDYTGVLLYLESLRFFPYMLYNQTASHNLFHRYYAAILEFFHSKGLLTFKKEYKPYKVFFKKKPYLITDLTYNNVPIVIHYKSNNDVRSDYGRYKTNQIVNALRRELPLRDDNTISYEEIIKLIS